MALNSRSHTHLLCTSHFNSPRLSFLLCRMGITVVLAPLVIIKITHEKCLNTRLGILKALYKCKLLLHLDVFLSSLFFNCLFLLSWPFSCILKYLSSFLAEKEGGKTNSHTQKEKVRGVLYVVH